MRCPRRPKINGSENVLDRIITSLCSSLDQYILYGAECRIFNLSLKQASKGPKGQIKNNIHAANHNAVVFLLIQGFPSLVSSTHLV
jgi:hypothetical protein